MNRNIFVWISLFLVGAAFLSFSQEVASDSTFLPDNAGDSEKVTTLGQSGNRPVSLHYDFWKGIHIGDKPVSSREGKEQLKKVLSSCPHAEEEYRNSGTLQTTANVFLTIGMLCNVLGLTTFSGPKYNPVPNICGLVALGISMPFSIGAATKQKNAVYMYNHGQCTGDSNRKGLQFRKVR